MGVTIRLYEADLPATITTRRRARSVPLLAFVILTTVLCAIGYAAQGTLDWPVIRLANMAGSFALLLLLAIILRNRCSRAGNLSAQPPADVVDWRDLENAWSLPLQTALIAFWADYWGTASAALSAVYFVIGWQIIAWRRRRMAAADADAAAENT